jgi:synaptic vesicle membrane protein VAT-1
MPRKRPCVVGYEAAGVVDALGEGAEGPAGGVGTAVLQLCSTVEDLMIFGTASAAKHEVLRAEGCTHPIDYRAVGYAAEVRRLTRGEGVDVVLDPLGGRDWRKGLNCCARAGG